MLISYWKIVSKQILKYEIPLIKRSLEEFFGNTMDRLTVIAVNRLKSVTFFKKNVMLIIMLQLLQMSLLQIPKDARPPDQNIEPGTIVDTDVTSPEITEFYLNSHRALQVSCFCLFEIRNRIKSFG